MRVGAADAQPLGGTTKLMQYLELHDWLVEFDAAETRKAYGLSTRGAHDCQCSYCRNFIAVRDSHYPKDLLQLFSQLGIDQHKEAEVSEMGSLESGLRLYSGFYHFVGTVLRDPGDRMVEFSGEPGSDVTWCVFFTNGRSLALETFGDLPLVQLDFQVGLPWALIEKPEG